MRTKTAVLKASVKGLKKLGKEIATKLDQQTKDIKAFSAKLESLERENL